MYVVIISRDRADLLRQCLETAVINAADLAMHRFILVNDNSEDISVWKTFEDLRKVTRNLDVLHSTEHLGVGGSKNLGISTRDALDFNCIDICFIDGDMYLLPGWDRWIITAIRDHPEFGVVGGWSHPYNHPNETTPASRRHRGYELQSVNAVAGGFMAMTGANWKKYGPFPDNARGAGQSEDWSLCQRAIEDGKKVGVVYPFCGLHCGITNGDGKPGTGADVMKELLLRQIEENGLQDKVIWK